MGAGSWEVAYNQTVAALASERSKLGEFGNFLDKQALFEWTEREKGINVQTNLQHLKLFMAQQIWPIGLTLGQRRNAPPTCTQVEGSVLREKLEYIILRGGWQNTHYHFSIAQILPYLVPIYR